MKVLLINNVHYRKGGAESVYFNTSTLLEQNGHQVYFFSSNHKKNDFDENSKYFTTRHEYRELSFFGKLKALPSFIYNTEAQNKINALIDEVRPDVAHVNNFLGGLSTSILVALKSKNVPIVLSVHDYRLICPDYLLYDSKNQVCNKCKDKFYLRCSIKRCSEGSLNQSTVLALDSYFRKYFVNPLKLVSHFIFVSEFIARKHSEFDSRYTKDATNIYNFIPDLKEIKPTETKGQYYLYFGRLSREKGLINLVEAFQSCGISLKIVGTGPLKFDQNLYPNIDFMGYKEGKELWNLVKGASFVIIPSEWYENNPLSILESYAHGKPVIGANIGGIPEIIDDGKTGYLFEPKNIKRLREIIISSNEMSAEEYSRMSENARDFAELNFNPKKHYQDLISIYKKVVTKSKN